MILEYITDCWRNAGNYNMADDKSKPAIPAWQRAPQQQPATGKTGADNRIEEAPTPPASETPTPSDTAVPTSAEPAAALAAEESSSTDATKASQLENVKTFLEDPAVKNEPTDKKRAFLEGKGISNGVIEQVRNSEVSTFKVNDFESFEQTQAQSSPAPQSAPPPQPAPQQQQKPTGPPIITYPEFLVEAHKPPPLITPARIVNTAYLAGGLAALIYGASKYLVAPMTANLTDARHEFASHSLGKIDEMNERLGKLVSKMPEPKKEKAVEFDVDDEAESETSDPTELFHRDMGTQTSPRESRRPSLSSSPSDTSEKKKDQVSYQTTALEIMKERLSDMLQRTEALEIPNKERQDSVNKLRQYLDTLMYASPGISMWSSTEDADKAKESKEDVVEDLKKEIRGVKGVLLSAKRFPGVAGRVGA